MRYHEKTQNDVRKRSVNVRNEINTDWCLIIFIVLGEKNNETSVPDADLEIPTLRSTGNAGNPGKSRLRHYPFTTGLRFLDLRR